MVAADHYNIPSTWLWPETIKNGPRPYQSTPSLEKNDINPQNSQLLLLAHTIHLSEDKKESIL